MHTSYRSHVRFLGILLGMSLVVRHRKWGNLSVLPVSRLMLPKCSLELSRLKCLLYKAERGAVVVLSVCICVCAGWWKEKSYQKHSIIIFLWYIVWYIINAFPLTAKAIVKFPTGISIFLGENLFYKSINIFWNNYLNVQSHNSGGEIFLWNCRQPKRNQKNW